MPLHPGASCLPGTRCLTHRTGARRWRPPRRSRAAPPTRPRERCQSPTIDAACRGEAVQPDPPCVRLLAGVAARLRRRGGTREGERRRAHDRPRPRAGRPVGRGLLRVAAGVRRAGRGGAAGLAAAGPGRGVHSTWWGRRSRPLSSAGASARARAERTCLKFGEHFCPPAPSDGPSKFVTSTGTGPKSCAFSHRPNRASHWYPPCDVAAPRRAAALPTEVRARFAIQSGARVCWHRRDPVAGACGCPARRATRGVDTPESRA